ncbi:hypothetical protein [Rhizobium tubonense]|uniref:Uncharacterized protein n=1 Tax=Rhizobium tubonense TaxID=484088 RepID=A0A2W4EQC8_9HYPH|nr:hypothetical protein [Rhizobium tubonense]PZM12830.1 hypothetical protein CPY51_14830 [Rhizobium tubonense]
MNSEKLENPVPEEKTAATMALEEFSQRFVGHMLRHPDFEPLHEGRSLRKYAEDIALTYWEELHPEGLSPEECADSDMSYWGR